MKNNYNELYSKLSRLQWLLQRYRMQNNGACGGPMADPTRGQGRVLALLQLQPEISTKDLSYLLGIRQQSLNELLNKLAQGGYIVREPNEADRRVMMVKLTDKGKNEKPQENTEIENVFNCLNEDEQAQLSEYLNRLITSLEEHVDNLEPEEIKKAWVSGVKSRLGDEQFERLMQMRNSMPHSHGFSDMRNAPFDMHNHHHHPHGMHAEDAFTHQQNCQTPVDENDSIFSSDPANSKPDSTEE